MNKTKNNQIVSFDELMTIGDEIWKVDDQEVPVFNDFINKISRSSFIKNAEDVVLIHSKLLVSKLAGLIDSKKAERFMEKLLVAQSKIFPGRKTKFNDEPMTKKNQDACFELVELLGLNLLDISGFKSFLWNGIPMHYKASCWSLMLKYSPALFDSRVEIVSGKRIGYLKESEKFKLLNENCIDVNQINVDCSRMDYSRFSHPKIIQNMAVRILTYFSIKSLKEVKYMQGMNDILLVVIFVLISSHPSADFITENFVDLCMVSEEDLKDIEADSFYIFSAIINNFQGFYNPNMKVVNEQVATIDQILSEIEPELMNHIKKFNINLINFMFRWFNNLLTREIPFSCISRLWDNYFILSSNMQTFHTFICAAFLVMHKENVLKEKSFSDLMVRLQNFPTSDWTTKQIDMLTSEGHRLMLIFSELIRTENL